MASTFCSLTDRYLIDIITSVIRHFYNKTLVCTFVTFGVVMYSLAGSLIPIRLWVFTCVSYVVIATHAGRAGTVCAAL